MAFEPLDLDAVKAAIKQPEDGHVDPTRTDFLADHVPALVVEIERLTVENRRLHAQLNLVRGRLHLAVAALCTPAEEVPDARPER